MVPQIAHDIAIDDTGFGNIELCRLDEICCTVCERVWSECVAAVSPPRILQLY